MNSCPFVFLQACSLNVNTLTLHKLITSEADGFHSEGVVFLHSLVMGELKNAMHTLAHSYIQSAHAHHTHTHTLLQRLGSLTTLPELSGVDVFSVPVGGPLSKNNSCEKPAWIFLAVHEVLRLQRFKSPGTL